MAEKFVRSLGKSQPKKDAEKSDSTNAKEFTHVQNRLTNHFESRVRVNTDGTKGEIKISFVSVEDLNRILEIIDPK